MKKPFTFWEYLFCRSGNVIETKDGRFYVVNNAVWVTLLHIAYIIIWILSVFYFPLYYAFRVYWPNLGFDYLLAMITLPYIVSAIRYRTALAAPAPDGRSDEKPYIIKMNRRLKKIFAFVCMAVAIFCLLNSVGLASLRGLINGGGRLQDLYVSHNHSDNEWHSAHLYNEDGSGHITTEPLPEDAPYHQNGIEISVMHTPAKATFLLNGKPPREYIDWDMEPFWFWENDYLLTYYYFETKYGAVRDGSTLTLTCGDLTGEWVFEMADEEAS